VGSVFTLVAVVSYDNNNNNGGSGDPPPPQPTNRLQVGNSSQSALPGGCKNNRNTVMVQLIETINNQKFLIFLRSFKMQQKLMVKIIKFNLLHSEKKEL